MAWHGMAWHGMAWQASSMAWHGMAPMWHGMARHGTARHGHASVGVGSACGQHTLPPVSARCLASSSGELAMFIWPRSSLQASWDSRSEPAQCRHGMRHDASATPHCHLLWPIAAHHGQQRRARLAAASQCTTTSHQKCTVASTMHPVGMLRLAQLHVANRNTSCPPEVHGGVHHVVLLRLSQEGPRVGGAPRLLSFAGLLGGGCCCRAVLCEGTEQSTSSWLQEEPPRFRWPSWRGLLLQSRSLRGGRSTLMACTAKLCSS